MDLSLTSICAQLSAAWTQATGFVVRIATRLASRLVRAVKPALVALAISACEDIDIARLCARAQEPIQQDIQHAIKRVRDLEDTVFDHYQRSSVNDYDNIDVHNHLLDMFIRVNEQALDNKRVIEDLQLALCNANRGWAQAIRDLEELKFQQSSSVEPTETRFSSSVKPVKASSSVVIRTPTTIKTRTLELGSSASVNAQATASAKTKSDIRQPIRWR